MDPNTFPTKGNLILAKNSLKLSRQGYELMDKKRNILIREMMELIDQAKDIQTQIDVTFRTAYTALQKANMEIGIAFVQQIACTVPVENSIRIKTRSVMGTEIPLVEYDKTTNTPTIQGAFERSLDRLKLDYVDLYLIHWPVPGCYLSTWKVLEEIQKSGRALSIGVSNFEIRHLEELEANSGIIPAVNQIECHPLCYPKELIDYCQDKGIQVQAYAPLARGAYLDNDVMCVLGTKYAHTPAQIGLRWATQKGISVIPKSVHPDRIRSNGNIFDFTIEQEDMDLIDTLNENFHSSHVPEDLRDIAF